MKKEKLIGLTKDLAFTLLGALLYSVSINMFSVPNSIVQGGLTGISIMLNRLSPLIPVGTAMFVMNIPLFILGFFKIGKGFVLRTLISTFVFTTVIDLGKLFIPPYSGDNLLACFFCGVFSGLGLSLVMLTGATTGGTEIVAMLVRQRLPYIPIGRMILFVDLLIISASFFVYRSVEVIMYAVTALFVSTKVIDFVLGGAGNNKVIFVVTDMAEEISKAFMNTIERGVTVLPASGGYSKENKSLVFCVARASEIARVTRILPEIDKNSFTVVGNIGEVLGNGWKST